MFCCILQAAVQSQWDLSSSERWSDGTAKLRDLSCGAMKYFKKNPLSIKGTSLRSLLLFRCAYWFLGLPSSCASRKAGGKIARPLWCHFNFFSRSWRHIIYREVFWKPCEACWMSQSWIIFSRISEDMPDFKSQQVCLSLGMLTGGCNTLRASSGLQIASKACQWTTELFPMSLSEWWTAVGDYCWM